MLDPYSINQRANTFKISHLFPYNSHLISVSNQHIGTRRVHRFRLNENQKPMSVMNVTHSSDNNVTKDYLNVRQNLIKLAHQSPIVSKRQRSVTFVICNWKLRFRSNMVQEGRKVKKFIWFYKKSVSRFLLL